MKLTNKDKKYLISIGYNTEDFSVIEETTKHIKYELFPNGDESKYKYKLNQKEVIKILGRDLFINGLGRATFHGSAVRYTETIQGNVISIYFARIK